MARSPSTVQEQRLQDPGIPRLMRGKSAKERDAFLSMLNKDDQTHEFIAHEDINRRESNGNARNGQAARNDRKQMYMSLVNSYYDLATDLYGEGWAQQSFHLCRFAAGESLPQALARHEHYLAYKMDIKDTMTVLDVGCGVGKPAREMATFTGCKIVGLNNNAYQIERATAHTAREGLSHKVSFTRGSFMDMDFPENTFDAAYAIETTVHAPSLQRVYTEIYRVMKPGGTFGVYEWVMTDNYDKKNPDHKAIRIAIEKGNGISRRIATRKEAFAAIQKAGFVMEHHEDLAEQQDAKSWYTALAGDTKGGALNVADVLGYLRMTRLGRFGIGCLLRLLEAVNLAPCGTAATAAELSAGADALVLGGRERLFTPMYLMVCKKPV